MYTLRRIPYLSLSLLLLLLVLTTFPAKATIVFNDDFSGDLSKWQVVSGSWGKGSDELSGTTSGFGQRIMMQGLTMDDFRAEYKIMFLSGTYMEVGMVFRGVSGDESNNGYWVGLKNTPSLGHVGLYLHKRSAGATYLVGFYNFAVVWNTWYNVEVLAVGQGIKVSLDGTLRIDTADSDLAFGTMGIMAWSSSNENVHFDDVSVDNLENSIHSTPEFGVGTVIVTSIATAAYLFIKRRTLKKK